MAERQVTARFSAITSDFDAKAKQMADRIDGVGRALGKVGQTTPGVRQLQVSLSQLNSQLARVRQVALGAFGAISAGLTKAAMDIGRYADEIGDFASTFGMAADNVRALDAVLKQADVGLQQFGTAAMGVVKQMQAAREGGGAAAAAFQQLGVDFSEAGLRGKSSVDIIGQVGEALAKVRDESKRLELAQAVGLSGRTLKAAMMASSAGLEAARQDPTFITDAEFEKMKRVSDQLDLLGTKAKNTWLKFSAAMQPVISRILDGLMKLLDALAKFSEQNPNLVATMTTLAGLGAGGIGAAASVGVAGMGAMSLLSGLADMKAVLGALKGGRGVAGAAAGLGKAGRAGRAVEGAVALADVFADVAAKLGRSGSSAATAVAGVGKAAARSSGALARVGTQAARVMPSLGGILAKGASLLFSPGGAVALAIVGAVAAVAKASGFTDAYKERNEADASLRDALATAQQQGRFKANTRLEDFAPRQYSWMERTFKPRMVDRETRAALEAPVMHRMNWRTINPSVGADGRVHMHFHGVSAEERRRLEREGRTFSRRLQATARG